MIWGIETWLEDVRRINRFLTVPLVMVDENVEGFSDASLNSRELMWTVKK